MKNCLTEKIMLFSDKTELGKLVDQHHLLLKLAICWMSCWFPEECVIAPRLLFHSSGDLSEFSDRLHFSIDVITDVASKIP